MRVVLPMARIAIRGQLDPDDVPRNVADLAIETAVRARQREARLGIVIKAPSLPTVRIVAQRAVRPQPPLMMAIPVAGAAAHRRSLEQQGAMALLTRHDRVTSDERKPGDIVIEGGYPAPADLYVTALATVSELALVPVILEMTGSTGRRQLVTMESSGMARIALHLCMRSSQWEFGLLVMIEANCAPLVLVVAAFALGTVPFVVDILKPVAIDARRANPLVALTDVASRTSDRSM